MSAISRTRLIVLWLTLLSAAALLAVESYMTSVGLHPPIEFPFLLIAASALAILSIPVMLTVGAVRKGAVTSMIIFEIIWFQVLSILFLTGASLAAVRNETKKLCGETPKYDESGRLYYVAHSPRTCQLYTATEILAFLIFCILFFYTLTLLILSITVSSRGKPIWSVSVKDAAFVFPSGMEPTGTTINQPGGGISPNAQIVQHVQIPRVQDQPMGDGTIPSQPATTNFLVPAGSVPLQLGAYQHAMHHAPGTVQV